MGRPKFSYENKKFYKRLRERFLEHIESLQMVSRAEIAMLQRLDDVYIRKAFAKRLKSDSKLSVLKVYQCLLRVF